jgi:hypothetical protein
MKGKSLKRDDRGLSHFHSLKNDLENDSDRIATSLPLFIRVMFFDKPNDWIKKINRFDFLRLACLDLNFPKIEHSLSDEIEICFTIYPRMLKYNEISLSDFFNSDIIRIKELKLTVQEFIFAVGYNGGIHMVPDRNKDTNYELIYESILEKYPEQCFELISQISKVFVDIFEEYESLLNGDRHAHSRNHQFQPMNVRDGKILDGIYFNHAYLQLAIISKKNKGLAIRSKIKVSTDINKNNIILSYGHQENEDLSVRVFHNGGSIFYELTSAGQSKVLRGDIGIFNEVYFDFEVSFLPDGKMALSINSSLVDEYNWNKVLNVVDGKIILGSNLSGNSFGEFYEKELEVLITDANGNKSRYRYYPYNVP